MKKTLVYIILCASGSLAAQPHVSYNSAMKTAFSLVVEMRFDEARKLVEQEKKRSPDNRTADYLTAAMTAVSLFVNEDQDAFEAQKEVLESAMERIEDLPESEPFRNLYLGELYTAQAILNGKFKNNLSAAWQFYKAYDLLTENYRRYPEFAPTYIPLGVMYAAIGSLPDEYQGMASLLGFNGSVEQGMSLLKTGYNQISADKELAFYKPYAGFVYSYADYQLGAEPVNDPENLGLDVASSGFLIYLHALYEVQNGKPGKAAYWLRKKPVGPEYLDFNYLYYLTGKTLIGIDPDAAKAQFETYLRRSNSDLYIKSTYRYLAWYYLLQGDVARMKDMQDMVFRNGSEVTGADRQAIEENAHPLNPVLVRARILFDAAQYEKALTILTGASPSGCCNTTREKAEYYYRLGRINERLDNVKGAALNFRKALELKDVQASFALGNSALHLALIYESQGQKALAKEYFKRCLGISNYPFYEGVHQKAKAGLSRLKER